MTLTVEDSSALIPGTYTMSITAVDEGGGSDTCTFDLELVSSSNACESVTLTTLSYQFSDYTVTAGQPAQFLTWNWSNVVSDDPSGSSCGDYQMRFSYNKDNTGWVYMDEPDNVNVIFTVDSSSRTFTYNGYDASADAGIYIFNFAIRYEDYTSIYSG